MESRWNHVHVILSSSSSSCPPKHVKTWWVNMWKYGQENMHLLNALLIKPAIEEENITIFIWVADILQSWFLKKFHTEPSMARAFNYLITVASSARWQGILSFDKQGTAHTHTLKTCCGLHSGFTKQPRADFSVFWLILWAREVSHKAFQS